MATTKTIALKIDVQDAGKISSLEQNLVKLNQRKTQLNKLVREGATLTDREAKELGELGAQAQATRNKINDLKNGILKQNNALKKNSGFVAGVRKGVGQWATSMIGVGVAIAGVTRVIGDAVARVKAFDSSIKSLSSITGATGDDLEFLKQKAIELGKSTTLTASQVADGFKLIASAKPELLENGAALAHVTEQAIVLSEAAGIDMAQAADALTLSMNQFGASADEASKFVDVLAAGSKKGAGDIEFLNAAFQKTGGAADTAGLSFVDTAAAIETLAPVMATGEEAGTKFRNILANLQKEGIGFASGQFDINDALDETNAMLNGIEDPAERAATRIELFGKQNDAAGIQLLNNTETLREFQVSLDETGVALEQQRINNSTVEASMKKLDSAYEGLILTIEDGDGAIANGIQGFAEMSANILNLITSLESAEGRFQALTQIGQDFAISQGIMNEEQAVLKKRLADNSNLIVGFRQLLDNGKITNEQYAEAVKKIANGWKSTKLEIEQSGALIEKDDIVSEDATEPTLTGEQKDRIKKAAKDRAKQLKEILEEAERESRNEDDLGGEDEEGRLDFLLDKEIEKNEALLSLDSEFLLQQQEQRNAALEEERLTEEQQAAALQKIEELKQQNRQATLSAAAGVFSSFSKLAKEGSAEQKVLASAGALINTYAGAAAALAPPPLGAGPIVGPLIAASTIANGLAQVAQINGVKFESGGILQGASHTQGGIPFSVGGQLGFEAEGGEAIINKRSTAMFKDVLSDINQAGGGVAFKRGGLTKKYQTGGLTPRTLGVTATQQGLSSSGLDLEGFSSAIIEGINDKEVINVATDTTNVATEVMNIESEGTF